MAVTEVFLHPFARDQGVATLDFKSGDRSTQAIVGYRVTCDSTDDTADTVRASDDLPALGDLDDKGRVCVRVQPERCSESPLVWDVQVEYLLQSASAQPSEATKWNFDVSGTGSETAQTAYQDKDGAPIQNSAGQNFDPSLTEDICDEEVSFTYDTTTLDRDNLKLCRGKVNSADVTFVIKGVTFSYPARTLRLRNATYSTSINVNDSGDHVIIWRVALVCTERPDTFDEKVLDCGFFSLDDSGKLVAIRDKSGEPVSAPVKLDGSGGVLASGGTPVFLTFKTKKEADFSGLFTGFPTS